MSLDLVRGVGGPPSIESTLILAYKFRLIKIIAKK